MHYNKQCNKIVHNGINSHNNNNNSNNINSVSKPYTDQNNQRNETNSTLSFEGNTKNTNLTKHHHEDDSDNEKYNKGTTTSCTSSTDSGVNISDNDEIPPSPISSHLYSFPLSNSSSSETTTTPNQLNKQFHKNLKNTSRDNGNKNNNTLNQYNNQVFNDDNNDDEDNDKISSDIDNKLKIEQYRKQQQQQKQKHFLNVENCSNKSNNSRFHKTNLNNIESENEININHQQHLTTATPTITVTTNNNNTPPLQQNEFNSRLQRSASTSSSFSMSSSNSNSNKHNPPSNMHHCEGSPVVSIRSINSSTIITDSDSDLDLNDESEGVHENYVIKKLGTQVSYPPNHPNIPHINSGQKVLNQRILPNDDHVPLSPLATLAAIGDNIGAAQALGPVPSLTGVPQRPQIGSIALSNSSDVTFGDKHFYEGPVTIQQFLIDSRDKWKETNEKDNPTFQNENGETINNAKDINSAPQKSGKRKKLIIVGVLSVMVLLIVAAVLGSKALSNSKSKLELGNSEESRNNIPINSTIAQDNVGGGYILRIVPRDGWLAQPSINDLVPLNHPIRRIIVIPTRTSECETQAACTYTVRITQTYNIESMQQDDIIYNFLIGGDGNVYEGRGWDFKGSVLKGFNDDSISFAYIGSFKKQPPSYKQLNVTKLLLQEGIRLKKISSDYKIVGANSLEPTSVATIADALYKSFENWPHWSD